MAFFSNNRRRMKSCAPHAATSTNVSRSAYHITLRLVLSSAAHPNRGSAGDQNPIRTTVIEPHMELKVEDAESWGVSA